MLGPIGSIYHGRLTTRVWNFAVLALAEALESRRAAASSVFFALFTGEEEGRIGIGIFHPSTPPVAARQQSSSMINLDMVGRMKDDTWLMVGWGNRADLGIDDRSRPRPMLASRRRAAQRRAGPSDHIGPSRETIPCCFVYGLTRITSSD